MFRNAKNSSLKLGGTEMDYISFGSRLYIYSGLGHGLYEEAKDFYARVLRFLTAG